jgi:hypothetical protein
MSTLEVLNNLIGRKFWYEINGKAKIVVKSTEAKTSFGHIRVLVTPLKGVGQFWVNVENLKEFFDIGDDNV